MGQFDELWRELEVSLSRLVDAFASHLDGDNLRILREFIDNREYGIALQWLNSLLQKRSLDISSEQKAEIQRLAKLMELNLDC